MVVLILILCCLIAALFGCFFLLFKLIAFLCNKSGNKWPLIGAGVSTVLLLLLLGLAAWRTYQRFARPLQPIVQAVTTQKEPVYGQHLYTDPTHAFQITQYDGTVFSDWWVFKNFSLLVGVDTNIFLQPSNQQMDAFSGFIILHTPQVQALSATEIMNQLQQQIKNAHVNDLQIQILDEPQPVYVGDDAAGSLLSITLRSEEMPAALPAFILVATKASNIYYVVGLGYNANDQLTRTLQSFQFTR